MTDAGALALQSADGGGRARRQSRAATPAPLTKDRRFRVSSQPLPVWEVPLTHRMVTVLGQRGRLLAQRILTCVAAKLRRPLPSLSPLPVRERLGEGPWALVAGANMSSGKGSKSYALPNSLYASDPQLARFARVLSLSGRGQMHASNRRRLACIFRHADPPLRRAQPADNR
jgi:hypothetical protein